MEQKNIEKLLKYANSHNLVQYKEAKTRNDYTFWDLYKIYSTLEIHSVSDLFDSPTDFSNFVSEHIKFFHNSEYSQEQLDMCSKRFLRQIKFISDRQSFSLQLRFANIVTKLLSYPNATSLLDVGAGRFPFSSIFLSDKVKSVTVMDPNIMLSKECLNSMNIDAQYQIFNKETIIDQYDFVVGRYPCSAIINMVDSSKKHSKKYFIELCDCQIPNNDAFCGISKWHNILQKIDPNIRFFNDYAYNLDISQNNLSEILENTNDYTDTKNVIDLYKARKQTRNEICNEK